MKEQHLTIWFVSSCSLEDTAETDDKKRRANKEKI